ncbi:MAG TPA: MFS transporter [Candidatus Binatia bacterium]
MHARVLSGRFLRLTVANFCFFMTFASFFLLPLHVRALGGTDRTVGFVMGTTGIAGLVGVFLVGTLIDRVGCRVFLRSGLALMAVVSLAFAFVRELGWPLFVLRGLQGLAFAAGFNAASTLAAAFAPPERRATALGFFGISTLTTHALAPTLGEQILRVASFHVLFAVAAAFSVIGLALAWTLPEPELPKAPSGASAPMPRALVVSLAATLCCGVAFGAVMTFVPTFAVDARLGPVSVFFLAYTSMAIMTRLWAGKLADDIGLRRMILPGMAWLAVSIYGLARVDSTLTFLVAGVSFGLAQGVVYPTLNAFSVDLAAEGQLGRVQAFYNGTFNLGITSGSFALGPVVNAFGHRTMFVCAAGAALLAFVLFLGGTREPAVARGR